MLTDEMVHDNPLHDEHRQRGARARAAPGMADTGRAGRTIAAVRGRFQDSRHLLLRFCRQNQIWPTRRLISLQSAKVQKDKQLAKNIKEPPS